MNTAVFPVTSRNLSLFHALREMRPELNINTAVIPRAFRKTCDPGTGTTVCHQLPELPDTVDTVLFLSFWNPERIVSEIRKMISAGKEVICYAQIPEEAGEELHKLADMTHIRLTFPIDYQDRVQICRRDDAYTKPESIAVAVGSMTEGLNTSDTVIGLYQKLTELGYTVSVLATDPDLCSLGFDILPMDVLVRVNLDQSIMMLNHYLNHHQFTYRADIVLIQLPNEGLHRTSLKYEVGFGSRTYLIAQAMSIDYGIMISPVLDTYAQTYQGLSEVAEKRYGFQYDCIRIMPKIVDEYDPVGADHVHYCGIPEKEVREAITALHESAEKCGSSILFTDDCENWADQAVQDLIVKLS